jgi:hypothetical protein
MNACVDALRYERAFVVLMQADTLATDIAVSIVRKFAVDSFRSDCCCLCVDNAKLYFDGGFGWGYSVVGPDSDVRFTGDGTPNKYREFGDWYVKGKTATLHIGWLSVDMAYRHLLRHVFNYPDDHIKELLILYEQSKDSFTIALLKDVGIFPGRGPRPLCETDSRYEPVIKALGLEDEKKHVLSLMGYR